MASVDGRRYKKIKSEGEMKLCGPCQVSGLVKDADRLCRQCDENMCVSDKAAGHGQQLADDISSMNAVNCRIENLKLAREKGVEELGKLQKSFERHELDVILGHIKECDVLIANVETELRTAEEARKAADDVTSVIAAHKLLKTRNSLEATVSDMEQKLYTANATFLPSRVMADVVTDVDRLGTVNSDRTPTCDVDPPMSASCQVRPASTLMPFTDMKVESSVDISIQSGAMDGSTILRDGRIVLAHYGQRQIILLDMDFNIKSSLSLQDRPWDVAADGDNDVIMSTINSKQLQWIHVDGGLRARRTVTTSHWCRGVAVHNDHIYISVLTSPSTGHVEVLTRDGSVVRRIGVDANGAGIFDDPLYITVGAPGTLYVADYTHIGRITCFTHTGDKVYDVTHNDMRFPRSMVADDYGNLLVCCFWSSDVHVLAKDGSHTRTILTSADGVSRPRSMAYRRSDGTLIITMDRKPYCRAYKLK